MTLCRAARRHTRHTPLICPFSLTRGKGIGRLRQAVWPHLNLLSPTAHSDVIYRNLLNYIFSTLFPSGSRLNTCTRQLQKGLELYCILLTDVNTETNHKISRTFKVKRQNNLAIKHRVRINN
jgi:hypothetical protein